MHGWNERGETTEGRGKSTRNPPHEKRRGERRSGGSVWCLVVRLESWRGRAKVDAVQESASRSRLRSTLR